MRTLSLIIAVGAAVLLAGSARAAQVADTIIALERTALDRWGAGDPQGFLDTYAPDITYFDIGTGHRLDGHAAMTDYYRPLFGRIRIPRYEMIDPKVQRHGDVAVLTYNLRSEGLQPDGKQVTVRWNSTAVYARIGGAWRMIHSHWSLTAPPCLRGIF
jgi:uncharacterized protein (TIGR02246 family)